MLCTGVGKTIITLKDAEGTTKSLEVTVSSTAYTLLYSSQPGTQQEFVAWTKQVGGSIRLPGFMSSLFQKLYYQNSPLWFHATNISDQSSDYVLNNSFTFQYSPRPNTLPFLTIKE
ncbi:hypothetical protein [Pseudomonas sp. rhizo66]|uniref:hypothetical protein n=1 Tax=Pseudomonas sp. rhizo66 TaxID=3059674 RepID=UPI00289665A2|nr:hypothetical protein [Pseudomonas sp. rhizo66]